MRLEEVILKALSKRPEERYQTGQEFDDAISRVADRITPGWQHALEPGADLSKMVPGAASAAIGSVAVATLPSMGTLQAGPLPPGATAAPPSHQAVYNPTPPVVKRESTKKKAAGCMGVLVFVFGLLPVVGIAAALMLR